MSAELASGAILTPLCDFSCLFSSFIKFFFFFSSRRRHTRFDCDWSSDVCSSDLPEIRPDTSLLIGIDNELGAIEARPDAEPRSEERRVGKECRSRWSPYH